MYKKVVALYGVPRSGTSWLGEILDSCPDIAYRFQPLFSYRFKNRILTESEKEDIEKFFCELYEEKDDEFINLKKGKENGIYPTFKEKKENLSILAYKEVRYLYTIPLLLRKYENIKIIGIVRNPHDVLESWINASSEFKPEWDIMKEWEIAAAKNEYRPENYYGYYKWKEYIKMNSDMRKEYPERFITVCYEDLLNHALEISRKLFSDLDIPFTAQTEEFIKASQSKTIEGVASVYRKKNTNKKRQFYLPEEIHEKISADLKEFPEAKKLNYF